MTKLTWIYLMRDRATGFYKIGKSSDPVARLAQLCQQDTKQPTPNDFELIEAWWSEDTDEKHLHSVFSSVRHRGEWFALGDDHLEEIRQYFLNRQPYTQPSPSSPEAAKIERLRQTIKALDSTVHFLEVEKATLLQTIKSLKRRIEAEADQADSELGKIRLALFQAETKMSELSMPRPEAKPKPTTGRLVGLPRLGGLKREEDE